MRLYIPSKYQKGREICLTVLECSNCLLNFAVSRWGKDTPCPLCGDNATRDYMTNKYITKDITEKGRTHGT